MTLEECFGVDPSSLSDASNGSIGTTSDPLIDKEGTLVRFVLQNINKISLREGLEVMSETAIIGVLQIDDAALTETNIYWNQSNRDKVKHQFYSHIGNSRVVCVSNASIPQGRRISARRINDGHSWPPNG